MNPWPMLIVFLLPWTTLLAQDSEPAGSTPAVAVAAACSAEEYRQFDFWAGEWNVTSAGQPAGTNNIQPVHNGCALQENWQGAGAGGITGSSFNIYDRTTGQWHQTWVDSSGTLLQIDGGMVDGSMVMSGNIRSVDGNSTTHRISWTPNDDGTVRQLWEASGDGHTWSVLFDGLYTRQ